jgi:hypothetical protein
MEKIFLENFKKIVQLIKTILKISFYNTIFYNFKFNLSIIKPKLIFLKGTKVQIERSSKVIFKTKNTKVYFNKSWGRYKSFQNNFCNEKKFKIYY